MKRLLLFSHFIFFFTYIHSQVVVNEYSASNLHSYVDSYGKTEDWIELYNTSDKTVNIGGWFLSDKEDNPEKYVIPENTIIGGNGFIVFSCSGRNLKNGSEYHTNFKLAQTTGKDRIVLSNPNGTIIDNLEMELTLTEHSRCREMDGAGNWIISTNPTRGTSNLSNSSNNRKDRYTATPTMDLEAGFYSGAQTVSIETSDENGILRYTTDGNEPTQFSTVYSGPITIDKTTVIKARTYTLNNKDIPGKTCFNTYFIDEEYSLPVFSVAADQVKDLANGSGSLIPIGSLEYFDQKKERAATAFGSLNRHGQDSWALDHRSLDWVTRDEMGYSKSVEYPLFNNSDRDSYQKFMFRNSGDDNYPARDDNAHEGSTHIRDEYVQTLANEGGMKLDVRSNERVVLFLNGEYWGVYGMRDRPVDHDYTKEYYDQGKYDLQYLTTWGSTTIQYGGQQALNDWENLRDFILENDMSSDENYKIAKDSINLLSLIDYFIVNQNVVASDWLNYNTGWWRGTNPDGDHKKWGYILWDLDATFDYYINYSGVPNTSPDAKPCDLHAISDYMDQFFGEGGVGKHEKIILKLLEENDEFKQLYYSRQADMMNTVFTCENMTNTLDSMLAIIEPEMPRQIARWGGTLQEWEQNVEKLKDFVNQRCTLLDDGMKECYTELTGPYSIHLNVEPANVGFIKYNTIEVKDFPWSGDYFGGMTNNIKASLHNSYKETHVFSHWESSAGNQILPSADYDKAEFMITKGDTLTAIFKVIGPGEVEPKDLVINEFMASNDEGSGITDPAGEYEDWIELYNRTDSIIDLSELYLSDDQDDLKLWKFPPNTSLGADEYLIVWADKDEDQEGLHADFKLKKSGESIYLSSEDETVIDSIIFGEQQTNIAFARIPNGTGDFVQQTATFAKNNESCPAEAEIITSSTGFCQGDSLLLEANCTGDCIWSTGSTDSLIYVSEAGTYYLTATDTSGCESVDSIVVSQFSNPMASIEVVGDTIFCAGSQKELIGSGGVQYSWKDPNGNAKNGETLFANYAGEYTLSVVDSNGCTDMESIVLDVYESPSIELDSTILGLCNGDTTILKAITDYDVVWTDPNGDFYSNEKEIVVTNEGLYTAMVTDSTNNCSNQKSIYVEEFSSPIVDILFIGDSIICEGTSKYLYVEDQASYLWTGPNGFTSTNQDIYITEGGLYTLEVTNIYGCKGTDSQNIEVIEKPVITDLDGSLNTSLMAVETYKVIPANSTSTYEWFIVGGNVVSGGTGSQINVEWTSAPEGKVCVREFNQFNCASDTLCMNVAIDPVANTNTALEEIVIYPNPTSNHIVVMHDISLRIEEIEIYNMLYQSMLKVDNKLSANIDVSTLVPGGYYIRLETNQGIRWTKFIKM